MCLFPHYIMRTNQARPKMEPKPNTGLRKLFRSTAIHFVPHLAMQMLGVCLCNHYTYEVRRIRPLSLHRCVTIYSDARKNI